MLGEMEKREQWFVRREGGELHEALLPFGYEGNGRWSAAPMRPFRPRGLLIWGAQHGDLVRQIVIGPDNQVMVSFDALPARWFAQADSYEQIAKHFAEGKEPPAWGTWDTIQVGMRAFIQFENRESSRDPGPASIELVMWGHAVRP